MWNDQERHGVVAASGGCCDTSNWHRRRDQHDDDAKLLSSVLHVPLYPGDPISAVLAFSKPYKNHRHADCAASRNPASAARASNQGTECDAHGNDDEPAECNVGKQAN